MIEWKECQLGDVCELLDCLHKTPKYSDVGFPMVRVTDIKNGFLNTTDCLKVDKAVFDAFSKGYQPNIGDIVFTRVGSYGLSALVKRAEQFCIGQNTTLIMPREIHREFIFYYLISPEAKHQIDGLVGGSTQPTISMASIRKILLPLPPLPEQKAIAAVLSSLDDKIDLLHRQNKTLEALAETLFRQWFVEENSNKIYAFNELVESVSIKHTFEEENIIFLNTSDVLNGYVLHQNYSPISGLPGQAKKSIRKGDILFSEIRPKNRRMAYIDFEARDYVVSTKLMVLRSKNIINASILFFYLKRDETLDFLQMLAEARSGTFPQITFDHLKQLDISVPSDQRIYKYISTTIDSILEKTFQNLRQIRTLEKLRDTLLPKLMSGEVRIKNWEPKHERYYYHKKYRSGYIGCNRRFHSL